MTHAVVVLGRSLRAGGFMFWQTLWPLVLGFTLSGAVQAFVPRSAMRRLLGDHRPLSVARAAGLGMASSSCSYAASAMARALVRKGADFVAAMVFMFASTNLVVELGIVLVVLMGWQFAAAEFTGGAVMIVLLALTGAVVVRSPAFAGFGQGQSDSEPGIEPGIEPVPHSDRRRWHSRKQWSAAAGYTIGDLVMVRRELAVGYLVAGALTVIVPTRWWHAVFLHGHGLWTTAENVVVGPLVALVSFVCSIGNVPLAAALYRGGISFGGVVSFLFADLLTFPLLLVYRRYYGTAVALRMALWFWAVMAASGFLVEELAEAAGLIPRHRSGAIVPMHLAWDATTYLNVGALVLVLAIYALHRGAAHPEYFTDPVCGMQVRPADAPASAQHGGATVWFCSERCGERFAAAPDRYRAPIP